MKELLGAFANNLVGELWPSTVPRSLHMGPTSRSATSAILFKVGALLLALLVALSLLRALPWSGSGVGVVIPIYQQGGFDLRNGHSPYTCAVAWTTAYAPTDWRSIWMKCNVYPPFLPLLFTPLTTLPLSAVGLIWELLSLGCALYVVVVLSRFIVPEASSIDRLLVVAVVLDVALMYGPLRHSMRNGEVDIELAALLVGSWIALRSRRQLISGLLLGLAIAIKPTYLVLVGFYLWRREWKAGGVALLSGAACGILPFLLLPHQALIDFLRVTAFWNAPGFLMAPKSISILGMLERACFQSPLLWHVLSAPFVARALEVMIGLTIYIGASKLVATGARPGDAHWDYSYGLAVVVMLLGSPLTEDEHLVLGLIPLALLAGLLVRHLRQREQAGWRPPLVLFAVLCLSMTMPYNVIYTISHDYSGWSGTLLMGYWGYTLIGLAVLYVWAAFQEPYRFTGPSVLDDAWTRLVVLRSRLAR